MTDTIIDLTEESNAAKAVMEAFEMELAACHKAGINIDREDISLRDSSGRVWRGIFAFCRIENSDSHTHDPVLCRIAQVFDGELWRRMTPAEFNNHFARLKRPRP